LVPKAKQTKSVEHKKFTYLHRANNRAKLNKNYLEGKKIPLQFMEVRESKNF
jgi:hypothetical protein